MLSNTNQLATRSPRARRSLSRATPPSASTLTKEAVEATRKTRGVSIGGEAAEIMVLGGARAAKKDQAADGGLVVEKPKELTPRAAKRRSAKPRKSILKPSNQDDTIYGVDDDDNETYFGAKNANDEDDTSRWERTIGGSRRVSFAQHAYVRMFETNSKGSEGGMKMPPGAIPNPPSSSTASAPAPSASAPRERRSSGHSRSISFGTSPVPPTNAGRKSTSPFKGQSTQPFTFGVAPPQAQLQMEDGEESMDMDESVVGGILAPQGPVSPTASTASYSSPAKSIDGNEELTMDFTINTGGLIVSPDDGGDESYGGDDMEMTMAHGGVLFNTAPDDQEEELDMTHSFGVFLQQNLQSQQQVPSASIMLPEMEADESMEMDMTLARGGFLSQQPAAEEEEEEDEEAMEMTMARGGFLPPRPHNLSLVQEEAEESMEMTTNRGGVFVPQITITDKAEEEEAEEEMDLTIALGGPQPSVKNLSFDQEEQEEGEMTMEMTMARGGRLENMNQIEPIHFGAPVSPPTKGTKRSVEDIEDSGTASSATPRSAKRRSMAPTSPSGDVFSGSTAGSTSLAAPTPSSIKRTHSPAVAKQVFGTKTSTDSPKLIHSPWRPQPSPKGRRSSLLASPIRPVPTAGPIAFGTASPRFTEPSQARDDVSVSSSPMRMEGPAKERNTAAAALARATPKKMRRSSTRKSAGAGSDISPDVPSQISLSQFLDMAGVQFMESFNTVRRRSTIGPSQMLGVHKMDKAGEEDKEASLQEYVKALTLLPDLEMYHWCCGELSKIIEGAKSSLEAIDEETSNSNPVLFREYIEADESERQLIETQFKIIKSNAHLISKQTWYKWRLQLIENLQPEYQKYLMGVKQDLFRVQAISGKTKRQLPEIRDRHAELKARLLAERAKVAEVQACDQSELSAIKSEVEEQKTQLESYEAELGDQHTRLEKLQSKLHELKKQKNSAVDAIARCKKQCDDVKGHTIGDVYHLKAQFEALEVLYGVKFVTLKPAVLQLNCGGNHYLTIPCNNYVPDLKEKPTIDCIEGFISKKGFSVVDAPLAKLVVNIVENRKFADLGDMIQTTRRLWTSVSQIRTELDLLNIRWISRIESSSDSSFITKFDILIPSTKSKVQVGIEITQGALNNWPRLVKDIPITVERVYGPSMSHDVRSIIRERIAHASTDSHHRVFVEACLDAVHTH